ncbi:hypothetical protein Rhe02_26680 [Rhizocola hellebori]|uniref:Uncharacterized protein n=1 Tax=Rhizocola hellebori TaxID=1392758 RepID=A0A8J3VG04_9ACTN|nr:hypothetical protein [Rhizocola hellebori]GIH04601.1 hypothetical protein Rhe02_26680 [Rhizocola hellebori]
MVQAIASHLSGRLVQLGERGLISVARKVFRVEAKPAELTLTAALADLLADSFVGAIAVAR